MANCEMIVIDIDRTTLTDDYILLPSVVAAVRAAQAAEIDVVPATARSPESLRPILAQLGLSGISVCFNGAWTGRIGETSTTTLNGFPLAPDLSEDLIDRAELAGLNPCWFTSEQWYAKSHGSLVKREIRATGSKPILQDFCKTAHRPTYKILCLEDPCRDSWIAPVAVLFEGRADFVRSDRYLVEVVATGVSKKSAIARLAAEAGLAANQIAAIGDSENDLQLIKWAGTGIAMGNATPEVKMAADWTTESNANGGVAFAIERLLSVPAAALRD